MDCMSLWFSMDTTLRFTQPIMLLLTANFVMSSAAVTVCKGMYPDILTRACCSLQVTAIYGVWNSLSVTVGY